MVATTIVGLMFIACFLSIYLAKDAYLRLFTANAKVKNMAEDIIK